jgi:hypothetical protein
LYWERALEATPNKADSKCLIGGGNLLGGNGSRLIFVNFNNTTHVFSNTQTAYDFRANSNNGTAVISAIGTAESDANRLYVATNDGTFFSSTDYGVSWTRQTSIMPATFRPWDIVTSATNANNIFISGTGFSNSGVYRSTDGGISFTAMNTGLPLATVFEMALAPSEQFLFAATSEGPYVYVFANNSWYPLIGTNTPLAVDFSSVDIVNVGANRVANTINPIVRFGTYGRGVWDFEITNTILLPLDITSFTGSTSAEGNVLQWTIESNGFDRYMLEKSTDGLSFATLKNFTIDQPNSTNRYTDKEVAAVLFYRLKFIHVDGSIKYSNIITLSNGTKTLFAVYPNPAKDLVSIQGIIPNTNIQIVSIDGKLFSTIKVTSNAMSFDMEHFKNGIYIFKYYDKIKQQSVKVVKAN